MDRYPAVAFIVRHARALAVVISLVPPVGLALLLHAAGFHWVWSAFAFALLPLTYLVARSYVEMVTIIADMLLPK
jgi:hypothetical protein